MSRTIINSSDGLNSWDIEQSTSTATNTGIVERSIVGVHDANFVRPLGDELVSNNGFDTDSNWTNLGAWTISNGKANNNGSSSGDLKQVSPMSLNVGSFYIIQFTVSNYISGLFDVNIGGNVNTIDVSSDGIFKYTLELTSAPNNNILLRPRATFNGSIDNVSVKEMLVNRESTTTNTGIVERPITGVSDGLNSWDIEQSTGTTNSTTTIRYINPPTIIPNLLSLLQARATYYENVTCTTAILTELETIEI